MSVTFTPKPIAINCKFWTIYKLIQLLMIMQSWGSITLKEVYFLIYVLDNNVDLEKLNLYNPIVFQSYFSEKIIKFALKKKLISFSKLRLILTENGKDFLKNSFEQNTFKEMQTTIKKIKKNKNKIKKYLKEMEKYYVKDK